MTALNVHDFLKQHIRTVPDWPAPGVQFRDITPLLQDPRVFRVLIDAFVHRYMDPALRPDVVAGLDARGFILGSVVASALGCLSAGLGFYMLHNTLQTQATQMAPEARGSAVTLFACMLFFGQSAGVLVAAQTVDQGGLDWAYTVSALGMLLLGAVVARQVKAKA